MKRVLATLIVILCAALVADPAFARKSKKNAHLDQFQKEQVDRVSAYLKATKTMRGDFRQFNPDGSVSDGKFYLKRPGRIRFEYAAPSNMTLLSDGTWVMLNDRELETVDRYPLRKTPLNLLLKRRVNLLKDADIVDVYENGEKLSVVATEDEGDAQGDITLVFSLADFELIYWVVVDPQGSITTVQLGNVEKGVKLDPELFIPVEDDWLDDDDWD